MQGPRLRLNSTQTTPFSLQIKILSALWSLCNEVIFRLTPKRFRGVRRALLRVFGAKVSSSASISNLARIEHPWNLTLQGCASIGDFAWIQCLDKVVVEDYAIVGSYARVLTGTHDISAIDFRLITSPTYIRYGAWVATGAFVMPGVDVREYSVVGAGSVCSKSTEVNFVYSGNPAVKIKERFKELSL